MIRFAEVPGGVRFTVHVQPRARLTEIVGAHGDALKLRLQAPPVDGAANEALVAFLAEALGVARRDVEIVSGASARTKVIEVRGVARNRAERALLGGGGGVG